MRPLLLLQVHLKQKNNTLQRFPLLLLLMVQATRRRACMAGAATHLARCSRSCSVGMPAKACVWPTSTLFLYASTARRSTDSSGGAPNDISLK